MGLDKAHWGMKRIVVEPITTPIQANLLKRTIGEIHWVKSPKPTHKIMFEYDWELSDLRLPSSTRPSGYMIGEEDGHWFLCNLQPTE